MRPMEVLKGSTTSVAPIPTVRHYTNPTSPNLPNLQAEANCEEDLTDNTADHPRGYSRVSGCW